MLCTHSFAMEYDIHTVLDALTLLATGGVIFCMLVQPQIKQTYQKEQDRVQFYYVVSAGGRTGCRRCCRGRWGGVITEQTRQQ